jgi:hypothetical protein
MGDSCIKSALYIELNVFVWLYLSYTIFKVLFLCSDVKHLATYNAWFTYTYFTWNKTYTVSLFKDAQQNEMQAQTKIRNPYVLLLDVKLALRVANNKWDAIYSVNDLRVNR